MMGRYAERTEVPVEKTRTEIESTVKRYGATGYSYGWQDNRHVVQFIIQNRRIKIELVLPTMDDEQFKYDRRDNWRTDKEITKAWEQEVRRKWRVLLLILKSRLEELDEDVPIEFALTPWILLPNGQTVGSVITERIDAAYQVGSMPPLLPE